MSESHGWPENDDEHDDNGIVESDSASTGSNSDVVDAAENADSDMEETHHDPAPASKQSSVVLCSGRNVERQVGVSIPTSRWDESTVWAANIAIVRRQDTPAQAPVILPFQLYHSVTLTQ